MNLGFSQKELQQTAVTLGLPTDGFVLRRLSRAQDLVATNKVSEIDDGIFRVRSQYDASKAYIVNVNHGDPSCDCPDGERTCHCKHRIASLLYQREQEQKAESMIIHRRSDGVFGIIDGNHCVQVFKIGGKWRCNCRKDNCKHIKAIRNSPDDGGPDGRGRAVENECGSSEAQELQQKLNGQHSVSRNGNGNGAHQAPSQPMQLDISDPFQESEQYDIDQIEGRRNGELAWQLSNGEYVISYKGIMTLAEKHSIEYSVSMDDDTNTVIAKATNGNERVSGKEIKICGFATTASELAKRNAARQLIPLTEIKAVEHKAKLNAEFNWRKAHAKCVELVGGKPQVDIIIHDLVASGKLRQDNPSHYDRMEWLIIHNACEADAQVERDPNSINNWSRNSAVFLDRCREAIEKVRENKGGELR